MTPKAKFIKSITRTAMEDGIPMPWERGARRAAFVARRKGILAELKRA